MSAAATPYAFTATGTVGPQNANGFAFIHGVTFTATAAATLTITDVAGNNVAVFAIAANGSLNNGIIPKVKVQGGASVVVSGAGAKGVLYVS
jgi:hypothetical protein